MSVLRTIESKLEALFEGVFGRAFRANVQPVEIARKLVKEMDEHRTVSVSRVYVPNEYTVYLSSVDRAQFTGYEEQLQDELQDYLSEHARRERYALVSPIRVGLATDDDLDMGMFGIATRLSRQPVAAQPLPAQPPATVPAATAPPAPEPSATVVYKPVALPPEPVSAEDIVAPAPRELATLTVGEQRHLLDADVVVLGRSKECQIQILDPNVSRRHAEVRRDGRDFTVVDLGSTNGIEVDGKRVPELALTDGSRFTVGSTEVVFSRETH
jgi:hypothetical protein